MTPDLAPIWTRLQAEVRRRVPESAYDIWLAPLRWGGIDGDRIVLLAPSEVRAWVQQRYAAILDDAARTILGEGSVARVELRDDDGTAAPTPEGLPAAPAAPDDPGSANRLWPSAPTNEE